MSTADDTSMTRVEVLLEAEHLGYWSHIFAPLDMASVYQALAEALAAEKAAWTAARAAGDDAAAARSLAEVRDLTALVGAAADGIADARRRWLSTDRPWPLVPSRVW